MNWWENFEFSNQMFLAPLLANCHQKSLFVKTNYCHERMFFDLLVRLIKPTYFFEIGAHEASTSQRLAKKLPETKCMAFEADPDVFEKFSNRLKKARSKSDNFSYVNAAISNINGQTDWYKQIGDKNIFLSNNSLRMKNSDNAENYKSRTIEVRKLDTFFMEAQPNDCAVLRIDAEGACYEVLAGAKKTLKKCKAIYAEIEDYEIWRGQKTVFPIYSLLDQAGFVPVSRDVQTPGQYNVLWLAKDLALMRPYRARLVLYYTELAEISREASEARRAGIKNV